MTSTALLTVLALVALIGVVASLHGVRHDGFGHRRPPASHPRWDTGTRISRS